VRGGHPRFQALVRALDFVAKNFAAPIVFYASFNIWGAKPAIASAVAISLILGAWFAAKRVRPSPIFLVASVFTVVFGAIDLVIATPTWFRFEPFAQNLIIGSIFLVLQLARVPVAAWFMTGYPKAFQMELTPANLAYLRGITWIWVAYLHAKAAAFYWMALHYDLDDLVVLRTVIGGGTLVLLIGGEILYRKRFRSGTNRS
jgi:intracellular septation protein A